jgi:hypothetical protein
MAFTDDQVGLERGATQLLLAKAPKQPGRNQGGGPVRASTTSLPGSTITVEFTQQQNRRQLRLEIVFLTEAQAATLRTLIDGTGPVTVKVAPGTSDTIACTFTEDYEITELVDEGGYPDNAPAGNVRASRAHIALNRLE